jgi:hypothetical protein
MKQVCLLLVAVAFSMAAIAQTGTSYGKPVATKKALDVAKFTKAMESKEQWTGVVKGTVKEVCKREGCWLRLDDGTEDGMMIRMKDHEFTVPKDIDGKTVYVFGTAKKTTTSVKMLQHYAEDAGKTKAEIEAITTPKTEITIDAVGVKVI